ncbi:TPA: hypothetical protein ACGSSZ_004811 [Vibrio parahaemolyticus]|uniref:hypothetical protein n=1 Tax=Vibrio parahaemolyticus TaxID=670 RepID=UPI001A2E2FE9|nr:hypothetical protein [Vibrio parahaemolyticus]ELU0552550.1 hypothetical protein [Vibrio parahaemolyticus]MBY4650590.1 hypothetical protein [Vibrio parahaemolyticus]HAS6107175.1 hypothetical protein [Vibrio vulnificus]HCZ9674264.1 hypothetical protein [Vibrio parahaemolyticus]
MTKPNYSITGLKHLLVDLENLSTCIISMPKEHVDSAAYSQLLEDQFDLIQRVNGYATMLVAFSTETLPE